MTINLQTNVVLKYKGAIVYLSRAIGHQRNMIEVLKGIINLVLIISRNFKKMIKKHGHQKNYVRKSLSINKSIAIHLKILIPQNKFCNHK